MNLYMEYIRLGDLRTADTYWGPLYWPVNIHCQNMYGVEFQMNSGVVSIVEPLHDVVVGSRLGIVIENQQCT